MLLCPPCLQNYTKIILLLLSFKIKYIERRRQSGHFSRDEIGQRCEQMSRAEAAGLLAPPREAGQWPPTQPAGGW